MLSSYPGLTYRPHSFLLLVIIFVLLVLKIFLSFVTHKGKFSKIFLKNYSQLKRIPNTILKQIVSSWKIWQHKSFIYTLSCFFLNKYKFLSRKCRTSSRFYKPTILKLWSTEPWTGGLLFNIKIYLFNKLLRVLVENLNDVRA